MPEGISTINHGYWSYSPYKHLNKHKHKHKNIYKNMAYVLCTVFLHFRYMCHKPQLLELKTHKLGIPCIYLHNQFQPLKKWGHYTASIVSYCHKKKQLICVRPIIWWYKTFQPFHMNVWGPAPYFAYDPSDNSLKGIRSSGCFCEVTYGAWKIIAVWPPFICPTHLRCAARSLRSWLGWKIWMLGQHQWV